ncbi:MAG: hypothetical protein IIX39_00225, partial [Clostridia bacterium]|nr:hypothetical protein [Clostridia bacterium]
NKDGIFGISLDNEQLLDCIYLYYNDTKLLFSGYDILQENELYVKIRLNAPSNGTMKGEMYITLWQGSSEIDIEYRFTALKDIKITGVIDDIRTAVLGGESYYYIRFEGKDTYYCISASSSQNAIILDEGETVTITISSNVNENSDIVQAKSIN